MFASRTRTALAWAAGGLLAAGCGTGGPPPSEDAEARPHGHVDGAQETAQPQWRLVAADTGDGSLHLIDPATEEVTGLGTAPGIQEAATDGRFAYLGAGDTVTVLDSGTWAVDHGDHAHYYRAEPAILGEVEAGGGLRAAGDTAVTALASDAGAGILDRAALEDGDIARAVAIHGGGALLPRGERLVAADAGGAVRVLDREGAPVGTLDARCPDPRGQALTRRGAVIGCSNGALLVTGEGDSLDARTIAYPDGGADPVAAFHHRPGAPVLAGRAGDEGVWVLDAGAGEWTLLETGPAAAVSAAGEDLPVLVLGEDGRLRAYDPESGEQTAQRRLMEGAGARGAPEPVIRIDTGRAYVNDPAADAVYEIDYNDDLRLARTFELGFSPDVMVETGW
ncbi:hypothetical protein LP52_09580 [Streptomonospora alba]|uniref:ABC transporter n=2 Tax=Streptomonospora alba TaxID=183763 RepID=A0A0C2JJP5_9ACTN|nr:hypothetical protein LP52_09580 [Streptomonospora alba]